VLTRAGAGTWTTRGGASLSRDDLKFQMASVLSGMYALSHMADRVLIEEVIEDCAAFRAIHGGVGVSDIRVIVLEGRPVMAMLRLPCRASGGRANLHAGGIAAGIDLASGRTVAGLQRGRPIERHPDSRASLVGAAIPHWHAILDYASRMNQAFELGYLGADFVVDARRGSLALEVNARPGLDIQLANRMGIRQAIEDLDATQSTAANDETPEMVPAAGGNA